MLNELFTLFVNDVALLTLSQTTAVNGTAQGNVQILMDGSNLSLPSATLDTLEVNPLLADGARIEALDALATYNH